MFHCFRGITGCAKFTLFIIRYVAPILSDFLGAVHGFEEELFDTCS